MKKTWIQVGLGALAITLIIGGIWLFPSGSDTETYLIFFIAIGYLLLDILFTSLAVRRIEVFQKIPILAVVVLVIAYAVITWSAVAFGSQAWHYLLLFIAYWILLTPFLYSGISGRYYIAPFSLRTAMFTRRVEKRYFEDAHKIQLKENKDDSEITFSYEVHSRTLRFENEKKEKVLGFLEGYPIIDV